MKKGNVFCRKTVLALAFLLQGMMVTAAHAVGVGGSGMYQWSVELRGYVSNETGKAPVAYLWVPDGCKDVKAVILSQQNMTEEAIYKNQNFQAQMKKLGVAMVWVAPAFNNNWDPALGAQGVFEEMMNNLADQSGHREIAHAPVIPLGHSAQATFPWNFAAWNPDRTLCIISFHGDAPRTNLCGYGAANVEWGRNRNIDGIPGLMIEGEYEWWEARVNPALAFRMMYPESCISFLCDTGRGHFDCADRTASYIAKFIQKAIEQRLNVDGTLRKLNPKDGYLAERFHSDMIGTDGADKGKLPEQANAKRPQPAPYTEYQGDKHDAFWYFDKEMADLTESRYQETAGKQVQYVGFEYQGKLISYNAKLQGGMGIKIEKSADASASKSKKPVRIQLKPVFTDETHNALSNAHGSKKPYIDVVCGPLKKINDTTFEVYPYEAGWDNPRRSFSAWVVAVVDADGKYKGAVQPLRIDLTEVVK
jgi:hypothetical protein